jgi:hypothetical protein
MTTEPGPYMTRVPTFGVSDDLRHVPGGKARLRGAQAPQSTCVRVRLSASPPSDGHSRRRGWLARATAAAFKSGPASARVLRLSAAPLDAIRPGAQFWASCHNELFPRAVQFSGPTTECVVLIGQTGHEQRAQANKPFHQSTSMQATCRRGGCDALPTLDASGERAGAWRAD